jgi:glutaredoxin
MNIPPFVLYGLIGCVHCVKAEGYLRKVGVPFTIYLGNDDPIIDEGIKAMIKKGASEYPLLLYKPTKELVIGFQSEKYERLVRTFYSVSQSSVPSAFGG